MKCWTRSPAMIRSLRSNGMPVIVLNGSPMMMWPATQNRWIRLELMLWRRIKKRPRKYYDALQCRMARNRWPGDSSSTGFISQKKSLDIRSVGGNRPRNQGAAAWELGENHVHIRSLPIWNAAGHLMQNGMVDLVLVGTAGGPRQPAM